MKNKKSKKRFPVFVISDCTDPNAQSRYQASFGREFKGSQAFCVPTTNPIEGAGCAIDIIDELRGKRGIVFLNIAPRRDTDKKNGHKNGKPFLYFYVGKTLVITSDEPEIFGMFDIVELSYKKTRAIDLFEDKDVPSCSQFRSAQCIPIAAKKIVKGKYTGKSHKPMPKKIGSKVWYIDNFGNCKTTLVKFPSKASLLRYNQLTEVPDGEEAQTIGSSGYKSKRFREFVIKGKSYAEVHGIKVGATI